MRFTNNCRRSWRWAGIWLALASLSGCRLAARNHNVAGVNAYQSGQISQAINEFQQALSRDPQNADAYYNLGSCYYALAKQSNNQTWMQQSEQLLRQSIALNDRNAAPHRALAALLVETNRQRYAFDLLHTWQRRHPELSDPLVELARLHQEFGDVPKAADYLADALRIDPSDPRTLKAMGRVRELQGNYSLALENYYRSFQRDGRQMDVAERINDLQARLAGLPTNPGMTPGFNGSVNPYNPPPARF